MWTPSSIYFALELSCLNNQFWPWFECNFFSIISSGWQLIASKIHLKLKGYNLLNKNLLEKNQIKVNIRWRIIRVPYLSKKRIIWVP